MIQSATVEPRRVHGTVRQYDRFWIRDLARDSAGTRLRCTLYAIVRLLLAGGLLLISSSCSPATPIGLDSTSQSAPATISTAEDPASKWAARWESEYEIYLMATAQVWIAYDNNDADGFFQSIDDTRTKGQRLLAAVNAAGEPPPRVTAAAQEIISALEDEPNLLAELAVACGEDGSETACYSASEAWASNGIDLMEAVKDVQS
jgi:hypothetical protein